jgi:hypothetical protein
MDTETYTAKLGDPGERCAGCSVPLAEDQRYCLNCGQRRGNARIPFMDVLRDEWEAEHAGGESRREEEAEVAAAPPERNWTPLVAAASGACVALVLGVGFLVGQSGDDDRPPARPQVVQVGGGGATPVSQTAFQSDWPEGQEGWTVQLVALPKASTQPAQVATAKTDVASKGAPDVGALDSDQHGSLDAGNYIVYSGVHDDEKTAKKALAKVRGDFPDAQVIQVAASADGESSDGSEVSDSGGDEDVFSGKGGTAKIDRSQLEELNSGTPEQNQKKSQKLPDNLQLPGAPPPKDDRPAGGGSDAEVIK